MKRLIVANWKMHPTRFADAKKLFLAIKKTSATLQSVQTVIAPPSVFLSRLSALYKGHRIAFSAQNVFWAETGSFTGEEGASMLKDAGATYTIIGHSERRALGETNEVIGKKVVAALEAKLSVILCIGESERNHSNGTHLDFLKEQLTTALSGISQRDLLRIIVAYEPIWAIGKSAESAMQPRELHEMVLFIKKIIAEMHGKTSAMKVPVIYGGAVEVENTKRLLVEGEADGLLVGHASLDPKAFGEILTIANMRV
jgi:triosephosphate isomerase